MSRGYNIVCLSSQCYRRKGDLWTNKQHIMSRLSKSNRILYVNPPSGLSIRRSLRLRRPFPFLERASENLRIFWSFRFTDCRLGRKWKINELITAALLRRCIRKLGMEKDLILWFYEPELAYLLGRLGERFVVYDCVDIMSAFPRYADDAARSEIVEKERRLVEGADLVLATTEAIYEEKRALNKNTHRVPNVGDYEHFSSARDPGLKTAEEVSGLKKPVIGFIGAVTDYKLDVTLLEEVARLRPEWSIALVGPACEPHDRIDSSSLRGRENVHFLGAVPYDRLPSYVKGFDVCTIPYAINEYTKGVFPIKFFEYLAAGKPVVATPLPALREYGDIVRIAQGAGGFITAVRDALSEEDRAAVRRRFETARRNSWDDRIRTILDLMEKHWPNTQSVNNQKGFE